MSLAVNGFGVIFAALVIQAHCRFYIDDFTRNSTVSTWTEHSDTIMREGKSKSSFVLHETGLFRRAVLFTMLNPQSCGAALAGIRKNVTLDLRSFKAISLRIKGQGQYRGYEFFLKQGKGDKDDAPNYVRYFQAPKEFEVVHLALKKFKPYWMGKYVENAKPLDKSHVTSIGIIAYGGAYLPKKQHGVASLEIEWIGLE